MIAEAWENIEQQSLACAWNKLMGTLSPSEKEKTETLVQIGSKFSLSSDDIEQWLKTEYSGTSE